ncbi:rhodanese-like domain-containing protein [Zwartia sp.]|uniref:rhodanese-like domain-containing protein n=1 Tax=Zwartia sp. TaxID=2978004 RepID=UPI00271580DC|nr:rhodanese-like domain-containing protein [Zwartia sp.]MDO9024465.1 rhodanese-like domain-containing protein [Zwartia sp.]
MASAENKAAAIDEMEGYLEFVDYGGGVIFAEQIPKEEWAKMLVIDARDPARFAKGHIPGAINMDWRQVLSKRETISKALPMDRQSTNYARSPATCNERRISCRPSLRSARTRSVACTTRMCAGTDHY